MKPLPLILIPAILIFSTAIPADDDFHTHTKGSEGTFTYPLASNHSIILPSAHILSLALKVPPPTTLNSLYSVMEGE